MHACLPPIKDEAATIANGIPRPRINLAMINIATWHHKILAETLICM